MCDELEILDLGSECDAALAELYEKTGKYKLAMAHYKSYMDKRDSISSTENQKRQLQTELNYEFEKKQAAQQAAHEKALLKRDAEKKQQRLYLYLALAIAAAAGAVSIIVFRSLRVTRKQKHIIELQKKEVEKAKHIIEEKNKETIDSIYYARRIQRVLITSEYYIGRALKRLKNT